MKVCTIERSGKAVLFDGTRCPSVSAAYQLFKSRYNKALGAATHLMLGHVGQRVERITRVGIDFDKEYKDTLCSKFGSSKKVKYYILGLIGVTYCRMFGSWDFGIDLYDIDEEETEQYLDWLMCAGVGNTMLYGRRDQVGRTNTKSYKNGRRKHKETGSEHRAA